MKINPYNDPDDGVPAITTLIVRKTGTPAEVVIKFVPPDPHDDHTSQRHTVTIDHARELHEKLHKAAGDIGLRNSRSLSGNTLHIYKKEMPEAMKAMLGAKLAELPIDINLGLRSSSISIDFGKQEVTPALKVAVLDFISKHEEGLISEMSLAKQDTRLIPAGSIPPGHAPGTLG